MQHRIQTNNEVEIIDKGHQYFGEVGVVTEIKSRPLTILNKPQKSGEMITVIVKLIRFNKTVQFHSHPNTLESQIRKIQ